MPRITSTLAAALWRCAQLREGAIFECARAQLLALRAQHETTARVARALGTTTRHVQRLEVALGVRDLDDSKANRRFD